MEVIGEVEFLYLVRRVMEMGTAEMVRHVRERHGESVMREALATAEPGNFSDRSWNYRHVVFGIRPTPPLPRREVPEFSGGKSPIGTPQQTPLCLSRNHSVAGARLRAISEERIARERAPTGCNDRIAPSPRRWERARAASR